MERDDEQLLRHNTREMGEVIAIFYHELVASGVPKKVAEKLTIAQWGNLITSGQSTAMLETLLESLKESDA